ncbi:hypothetical protein EZI54_14430 [Marinobacter halodurans]|uniref:DUF6316 domain-containing protein n=1 Tax=Marinobacter halodurans TaxID=2528979 RepID=A0ABY1ZMH0_9GAMM|nr:DUF6316 family protein [Marinobacter halodurans]TBW54307.1 hypothetical protein EZI54_14430 [Marinobacter halodurans]
MSVIEQSPTPLRSERFLHTVLGWYVRTRENIDLGPFASRDDASDALNRHIRQFRGVLRRDHGTQSHGMDIHDPESCHKQNCAICMEARIYSHTMRVSA